MSMKHFAGKSTRMRKSNCTGCGTTVDAATAIDNRTAEPSPGDITVCLYCGRLMAFADDLAVRDLTDAEMIDAAADERILAILQERAKLETKQ